MDEKAPKPVYPTLDLSLCLLVSVIGCQRGSHQPKFAKHPHGWVLTGTSGQCSSINIKWYRYASSCHSTEGWNIHSGDLAHVAANSSWCKWTGRSCWSLNYCLPSTWTKGTTKVPKIIVYGLFLVSSETVVIKENGIQMTGSIRGDWKQNDLNQLKLRRERERVLIASKGMEK